MLAELRGVARAEANGTLRGPSRAFFCPSRAFFHPSRALFFPSRAFFLRDSDRELAFLRLYPGRLGRDAKFDKLGRRLYFKQRTA